MDQHWKRYRRYKYRNLTLGVISLIVTLFLLSYDPVHQFIISLGELGYFGAFLAGIFFVSTFTIGIGASLLLILAERLSAWEIGLIAGIGSMIGDIFIFRLIRTHLKREIELLYEELGGHHLSKLFQSRYFSWTLPLVGAIIIASPLPDDLGVSLIGISKMKTWHFLILSFVLNAVGIFAVVSTSIWIKP